MEKRSIIYVLALMCALVLAVGTTGAMVGQLQAYDAGDAADTTGQGGMATLEWVYNTMLNDYYTEIDPEVLIEGAIEGMLGAVDDPYTFYYTKDEWEALMSSMTGQYVGIGVQVLDGAERESLLIIRCYEGSPAAMAGLMAGDEIVAVDGHLVADALQGVETQEGAPAGSDELMRYMRGEEGSQLGLTVSRDGELFDVTVTRAMIDLDSVKYCMLDDAVGYMTIYEFQGDAVQGVNEALWYFGQQGAQSLIVDLRDNPGGDLDVVTRVADALLPEGLYAYMEDREGNRKEFHSDADCWGKPIAVLVNGNSASASELLAGAAKDMGAATIVGETTFGKGIVQVVVGLPGGAGMQMTTERYFTPSGHVIHGNGIAPDIAVACDEGYNPAMYDVTADGDWKERDAQLRAAYEALIQ